MRLLDLVVHNILRRPLRSLLTLIGVAVAVGAVVALVGIAQSFERSLLAVFEQRGVDLIVVRRGSVQRMNSSLKEELLKQIASLEGVREVSGGLIETLSLESHDLFGIVTRGVPPDSFLLRTLELIDGRLFTAQDRHGLIMGRVLAANLGVRVGDKLALLPGHEFTVLGIYESYNVFENGSMFTRLDELQRLLGREGDVTAFIVKAERQEAAFLEALRSRIEALAPYLEATPARQYVENTAEIRIARAAAWLTSSIALMLGVISMINTMSTAVFERTREIALLRAIGWRRSRVMRLILLESVLLSVAGAVLGSLLALGVTNLLSLIPASGRIVAGNVDWSVIAKGFSIALGVGILGGLGPALRAMQLQPTVGLRHE